MTIGIMRRFLTLKEFARWQAGDWHGFDAEMRKRLWLVSHEVALDLCRVSKQMAVEEARRNLMAEIQPQQMKEVA